MSEGRSAGAGMRFSLLGPVRAWRDGQEVALGSPQQRALLVILLLRRGRPVTADALVGGLWGEEPPPRALGTVRTYISRLRKVMEPDSSEIDLKSVAAGYLLQYPAEALDLTRFERLIAESGGAADPARAAALAHEALGLWVGEPLAGVPGPFAEAQRDRLSQVRLGALERRITADLAAGRHAELVTELPALVAAHPLREHLVAALMLALYRCGRQADALRAYDDTRRTLAEELGADPGPDLRALHRRILNADPELAAPSAPTRTVPAQLPADLADFAGRGDLVVRLSEAVTRPAGTPVVAAVTGIGGAGKTSLAVHVAHATRASFPDGQLYLDLRGVGEEPVEPGEALARFLRSFGVPADSVPEHVSERAALLRSTLADRRVLLLLDNARDTAQVEPLLPATAGCAVLVTSRARLVSLHATVTLDLDGLDQDESLALLSSVLGDKRIAAEPDATRELVELCAGLPLALRIVASRLAARPQWTIESMVERLRDERGRLDELRVGSLAVESTIRLGYRQLPPDYAWALRMLSIPAAPQLSRHAAAAILNTDPRTAEDVAEALVDLSLLSSPSAGRYTFHDLVRATTRRLAREPEPHEAPERLLGHYLASMKRFGGLTLPYSRLGDHLATTSAPGEPLTDAEHAHGWLADENGGLLDTVAQVVNRPDGAVELAADLLVSLWDTVELEIRPVEVERVAVHTANAAARLGDRRAEGRARTLRVVFLVTWERWAEAQHEAVLARRCCADTGDTLVGALAAKAAGTAALSLGQPDRAAADFRAALTAYQAADDQEGTAGALIGQAAAFGELARHRESVAAAEEALDRFRDMKDQGGMIQALSILGRVLNQAGDPEAAIGYLQQGHALVEADPSRLWQGRLLFRLAQAYLAARRYEEALRAGLDAQEILREIGQRAPLAAVSAVIEAARAHTDPA